MSSIVCFRSVIRLNTAAQVLAGALLVVVGNDGNLEAIPRGMGFPKQHRIASSLDPQLAVSHAPAGNLFLQDPPVDLPIINDENPHPGEIRLGEGPRRRLPVDRHRAG